MRRSLNHGRSDGRRFDAVQRVTTEALVFLGELDTETMGEHLARATHYEPSPPRDVDALLDEVPFDVRDATFIDAGSGMGRAVFIAARRPFRQVVGVEFSGALHEIAKDNASAIDRTDWRCRDVRFVNADITAFRFPRGRIVAYLFNPFDAHVLGKMLEAMTAGPPREIALLYHTPVAREAIEACSSFLLVRELPFGAVFHRKPFSEPA